MNYEISELVWNILICPHCTESLSNLNEYAFCRRCKLQYDYTGSGALDLRLQQQKKIQYEITLGSTLFPVSDFDFNILQKKDNPEVDFSSIDIPYHLTEEMMSYFPKAKTSSSIMLDLGCGSTIHRKVCELAGYKYVGLDYKSHNAAILADAHSLPFEDKSFDFILSVAVLEHIQFPFVMMKEVYRVLKQNGIFIGTVAFLEPFHGNSFYHHTHLGTFNTLREGGFVIEYICPDKKWSVLIAHAKMSLFPQMPQSIAKLLVMPLYILHKLWWMVGSKVRNKEFESERITSTTGAFTFIARR